MAAFEVLALDTATPQIRAPGASDTYTFPRAVELPLGTANGVLFLNASNVVTSGSALTFDGTTFSAPRFRIPTGGFIVDSQSNVIFNPSAGGSLSITSNGAFTNGNILYNALAASGIHVWQINSSEAMRLNSTGLGIGTNNPIAKVNAVGAFRSSDAVTETNAIQMSASATAGTLETRYGTPLIFGTNASEKMRLDASGNLGLGTTPNANWGSLNGGALQISNGAAWARGGDELWLSWNVYHTSANQFRYLSTAAASAYQQSSGSHIWRIAASGTAGNTISFTQAMTLDASGNLALGTTSADSRLHVTQNAGSIYQIRTTNNSTATDARSAVLFVNDTGHAGYVGAHGSNTGVGIGFPNTTVLQGTLSAGVAVIASNASGTIVFHTGGTASINRRALIPAAGGVVIGNAALATNATDGFLYVPTCAGTPTGTPTAQTGTAPIVVDTTNNKLYFYSGGAWRDAGP